MQFLATIEFIPGRDKGGGADRIDEKLPVFIVKYILEGNSVVSSPMVVHMLQPQCNLLQIPLS